MEKKLKRKCIMSVILIIVGIIMVILALKLEGLSEMQQGYMSGFGNSIAVGSLVLLIKNLMALKSPKDIKKREIESTDERNIEITTKSMAITFRICILLQALASAIFIALDNELGISIGLMVGVQLIVYCISSVIISRKI